MRTQRVESRAVFGSLALPWLVLIFVAAAGAIWLAGIALSDTSDVL
jgi:lysylphosphatidylglycerol synthetase-like protein (DUF2156 family)